MHGYVIAIALCVIPQIGSLLMRAAAAEARGRTELAKDCDKRLARIQEDCMQRLKSAARKAASRCALHGAPMLLSSAPADSLSAKVGLIMSPAEHI